MVIRLLCGLLKSKMHAAHKAACMICGGLMVLCEACLERDHCLPYALDLSL